MKHFSRAQRRRLARRADEFADAMSRTIEQRGLDGKLQTISDPTAVRALRRGFRAVLRGNCRPVVHEIGAAEGDALRAPGLAAAPRLPGIRHWAAFGFDVEGEATFVTEYTLFHGLSAADEAAEAERLALERLARVCNAPGIPAGGAR